MTYDEKLIESRNRQIAELIAENLNLTVANNSLKDTLADAKATIKELERQIELLNALQK